MTESSSLAPIAEDIDDAGRSLLFSDEGEAARESFLPFLALPCAARHLESPAWRWSRLSPLVDRAEMSGGFFLPQFKSSGELFPLAVPRARRSMIAPFFQGLHRRTTLPFPVMTKTLPFMFSALMRWIEAAATMVERLHW